MAGYSLLDDQVLRARPRAAVRVVQGLGAGYSVLDRQVLIRRRGLRGRGLRGLGDAELETGSTTYTPDAGSTVTLNIPGVSDSPAVSGPGYATVNTPGSVYSSTDTPVAGGFNWGELNTLLSSGENFVTNVLKLRPPAGTSVYSGPGGTTYAVATRSGQTMPSFSVPGVGQVSSGAVMAVVAGLAVVVVLKVLAK